MKKILCISDVHGEFHLFPPNRMPDADVVFICGDMTDWGLKKQAPVIYAADLWLRELAMRYKRVFWIPGNHDWYMRHDTFSIEGVECIMDETLEIDGYKVHGIALTVAYNMPKLAVEYDYMTTNPEAERLAWDFEAVDIVISHGPAFNHLDYQGGLLVVFENNEFKFVKNEEHLGSERALEYIQKNKPKLFVCGHIHASWGIDTIGNTTIVNTACKWSLIEFEDSGIRVTFQ